MKLEEAKKIADKYLNILKPFCSRIEIAGSIRREKLEVKDIEIVAIPDYAFEVGGGFSSFCKEVKNWQKVKGEPTGKYTQRILPEGIKLDLFMATPENWGLIFAIRTGSAGFSHEILARSWVKAGYKSVNGMLTKNGEATEVKEEEDLFKLIGLPYVEPKLRI